MSKNEIVLEVPEEVHDLFIECYGAMACRDRAIESIFGSRKAIKFAKKAESAKVKAWRIVKELYPKEYEEKDIKYNGLSRKLYYYEEYQ